MENIAVQIGTITTAFMPVINAFMPVILVAVVGGTFISILTHSRW